MQIYILFSDETDVYGGYEGVEGSPRKVVKVYQSAALAAEECDRLNNEDDATSKERIAEALERDGDAETDHMERRKFYVVEPHELDSSS